MAQNKSKLILRVVLELDATEALYLKQRLQNDISTGESVRQAIEREAIFEALPSFEELEKANAEF